MNERARCMRMKVARMGKESERRGNKEMDSHKCISGSHE
jgi:hypothetical protein